MSNLPFGEYGEVIDWRLYDANKVKKRESLYEKYARGEKINENLIETYTLEKKYEKNKIAPFTLVSKTEPLAPPVRPGEWILVTG